MLDHIARMSDGDPCCCCETENASREDVPFVTRLLVERPADAARFNGTVWVEWLNVSGVVDAAIDVIQAREQIIASGGAWVGISAQKVGVDSLRATLGGSTRRST